MKKFMLISAMVTSLVAQALSAQAVNAEQAASGPESFDYDEDFQYMYQNNAQIPINRVENGYYIRWGDVLYYAAEDLSAVIPVCYKPECVHGESKTMEELMTCGAFLGAGSGMAPALQLYKNYVYVTSVYDLNTKELYEDQASRVYRISTDGTEKTVFDSSLGLHMPPVFHRGYCYYAYEVNEEQEDGDVKRINYFVRKPDSGGEEEILFREEDVSSYGFITAYRDYVYFDYGQAGENRRKVYQIETGEITDLKYPTETDAYASYASCFEGDHLLQKKMSWDTVEGKEKIWQCNLDGSNPQIIFEIEQSPEENLKIFTDGTYFFVDNSTEQDVFSGDRERILQYYDRETQEYLGEMNLGTISETNIIIGDENYFFYQNYDPETQVSQLMYVDKKDLANGTAEGKLLVESSGYSD